MKFLRLSIFLVLGFFSSLCAADNRSGPCSVYFSQKEPLIERFISLVNEEQRSIQLAAYCLRHARVGKALIEAQKRGVRVEIVVDPFSVKADAPLKKMANNNINVYVWNPGCKIENDKGKKIVMGDTFCIFGGKKVWTGSAYFSQKEGPQSCGNAIIMEQEEIVAAFLREFESVKVKSVSFFDFKIL